MAGHSTWCSDPSMVRDGVRCYAGISCIQEIRPTRIRTERLQTAFDPVLRHHASESDKSHSASSTPSREWRYWMRGPLPQSSNLFQTLSISPPPNGGFFARCLESPTMKERATVLCKRGDRILLVARSHARWVLPGGKPHRGESLSDAARRELAEETSIVCHDIRPVFQFAGGNKQHHVFVADIEASAIARPAQEIVRCAWFDRQAIASIDCSRPTPLIVERALDVLEDAMLPAAA